MSASPRRGTVRTAAAALVAAPWVVWAVFRVGGLDRAHPLIAMVSFTPYVALTAPLPLIVALLLRRWIVAAVALVAVIALAAAVLPRGFENGDHRAAASDRGPRLTVMSSNLEFGEGDPRAVLRLVRDHDVDVLSLQEVTPDAIPRLDRAGGREVFPNRVVGARPGAGGSAVLTRWRLRAVPQSSESFEFAAQPEGVVTVPGAGPVAIKAVHPPPPTRRVRVGEWRTMFRAFGRPRDGATPRILAGDFNATLDHREFRRLLDRGWFDAADATGDGLKPTWPADDRRRPSLTIDHVLVPPPIKVRRVSIHEVPGSDHRAVIAELALPPE